MIRTKKIFDPKLYLLIGVYGLFILTTIPFLSERIWWADLFEHFRPHFLYGLIVLCFGWLWLTKPDVKRFKSADGILFLGGLFACGLNFALLWPYPWPIDTPYSSANLTTEVEIAHLNTNRGSIDLTELETLEPDILFLQEVTPELARQLNQPSRFKYLKPIVIHPLDNTHGSALLLRQEFEEMLVETKMIHLPDYSSRPLLTALFEIDGRAVRVMSVHTTRPSHKRVDHFQQLEFEAIAAWSVERQATGEAILIIGDFNATPWSSRFQTLLSEGALTDSMRPFGVQNSWPGAPLRWAGIPIDGAVHSEEIYPLDRRVHAVPKSDHALLTLRVTQKE